MLTGKPSLRAGIYLLRTDHIEALERLSRMSGGSSSAYPYPPDNAKTFVERCAIERTKGETYVHAIMDGPTFVGLCGIHHVQAGRTAELCFWIGSPYRGRGFATVGSGNMLDFAFGPLRLEQLTAHSVQMDLAARRILTKKGFREVLSPQTPDGISPAGSMVSYELTRAEHHSKRLAPFLEMLCKDLRPIVAAEIAAGNEVGDCTRGWPQKESIVIAFRKPFRSPTGPLPPNVVYREVNDTHWWKAEYASKSPVHLLTCGFE